MQENPSTFLLLLPLLLLMFFVHFSAFLAHFLGLFLKKKDNRQLKYLGKYIFGIQVCGGFSADCYYVPFVHLPASVTECIGAL